MPISFTCKCDKRLRADDSQAGKRVKCPACGRALVVPAPARADEVVSDWQVDASPLVQNKAERAGVVRRGQASVARLHRPGGLEHDLSVSGAVTCRICKTAVPFEGKVFGRAGLGGTVANLVCSECRARYWVGYVTHAAEDGTDVFLYAPSLTRDFTVSDDTNLPSPPLCVNLPGAMLSRPKDGPEPSSSQSGAAKACHPDKAAVDAVLAPLVQAVRKREPYQQVRARAGQLVREHLAPVRAERICVALRELLDKETKTHLMAVLAETLACLRDEEAVPAVRAALRRALDNEDVSDASNEPLLDLCLVALLFGDRSGFLQAVKQGLPRSAGPTRARKLGKGLKLKEVISLLEGGDNLDAMETDLGGGEWNYVYSVFSICPEDAEAAKEASAKGFLSRFFRKKDSGLLAAAAPEGEADDTPAEDRNEALTAELCERFEGERVDLLWLTIKDEKGAKYDYQRLLAETRRHWSGHGVVAVRGCLAETMATSHFVGLICRHSDYPDALKWFRACSKNLWNCKGAEVLVVQKQEPDAINIKDCMYTVAEFAWVD